jgi:hypothetical protein
MGVSYIHLSSPSISDNGLAVPAYMAPLQHNAPLGVRYGFSPGITLNTPTRQVLSYIFAPPDNTKWVIFYFGGHRIIVNHLQRSDTIYGAAQSCKISV